MRRIHRARKPAPSAATWLKRRWAAYAGLRVTTNHVLVSNGPARRHLIQDWGQGTDVAGYDLPGWLTGSEGTHGVDHQGLSADARAGAVKTMLAVYNSAEDAGRTVTEITARAIMRWALEMLDGFLLRYCVEEATHAGYH